ncbi:tetraspanin-7-like [Arapaima gigas]
MFPSLKLPTEVLHPGRSLHGACGLLPTPVVLRLELRWQNLLNFRSSASPVHIRNGPREGMRQLPKQRGDEAGDGRGSINREGEGEREQQRPGRWSREREGSADKAAAVAMNSALPYNSLPGRPSPSSTDWERETARRLSSPRGLALLRPPTLPRRPSAPPGILLSSFQQPQQESLSVSLCSEASLAPPALPQAAPCCMTVGAMALLRLGLLLFSCLFWAAGLALFTLGVWAHVSLADYVLLSTNRYPNAPVVLLATGAAVTTWGFLGCLGAAAKLPCLLRAYGLFQLVVLVAGLAAGLSGLFYREEIAEGFHSGLQQAVAAYAEDDGRANALDSLQRALECCGAEGWMDWLSSEWATLDDARPDNTSSSSVPDSCCIRRKGCRNRPLPAGGGSTPEEARIHPDGCFRKVFSIVNDNVFHIATTVLSLAFTQAAGIALSCLLANRLTPALRRGGAH